MAKSKSPKSQQQNSTSKCFQINLCFFAATVAITSQLKRPHFLHDLIRKSTIRFGKGRVRYGWLGEEQRQYDRIFSHNFSVRYFCAAFKFHRNCQLKADACRKPTHTLVVAGERHPENQTCFCLFAITWSFMCSSVLLILLCECWCDWHAKRRLNLYIYFPFSLSCSIQNGTQRPPMSLVHNSSHSFIYSFIWHFNRSKLFIHLFL